MISASAAGASGKAEDARAAVLPAAETGSPSPAQAFRLDARPSGSGRARSSRAAASASRPASNAGRPAGEIAPQPTAALRRDRRLRPAAKRRSRSAPSSALRRRILAEAAALFSARRERSAPAAGGSRRRGASRRRGRRRRKTGDRPALPFPLARAQAGTGGRRRKGLPFRGFRRGPLRARAAAAAARERPRRARRWGRPAGSRSARITWAWRIGGGGLSRCFWA